MLSLIFAWCIASAVSPSHGPLKGLGCLATHFLRQLRGKTMTGHEVELGVTQLLLGAPTAYSGQAVPPTQMFTPAAFLFAL